MVQSEVNSVFSSDIYKQEVQREALRYFDKWMKWRIRRITRIRKEIVRHAASNCVETNKRRDMFCEREPLGSNPDRTNNQGV